MRVPIATEPSKEESRIVELQLGFAERLRKSQYYVVEKTKTTGVYHTFVNLSYFQPFFFFRRVRTVFRQIPTIHYISTYIEAEGPSCTLLSPRTFRGSLQSKTQEKEYISRFMYPICFVNLLS